ncbi:MAG TPA: chemotaxis protein CheB [Dyella sp.]|nr:chemotaxis protein CheB [Dyella sp.]
MTAARAIVIGGSAGTFSALQRLLPALDSRLPAAVIVCCHLTADTDAGLFGQLLSARCALPVTTARERAPIEPGTVHVAPGGYHLLVEHTRHFALSVDPPVNYSRPSIDVLFESAAAVYGPDAIGVVLTGANADGAGGLHRMRQRGATAVVQDPATAEAPQMPQAALDRAGADYCVPLDAIPALLNRLCLA